MSYVFVQLFCILIILQEQIRSLSTRYSKVKIEKTEGYIHREFVWQYCGNAPVGIDPKVLDHRARFFPTPCPIWTAT